MTRRPFLKSASISAGMALLGKAIGADESEVASRKMTINLVCGAIGVQANQHEAIALAAKHGFESVEARPFELAKLDDSSLEKVLVSLRSLKLSWGTAGLPIDFRVNDADYAKALESVKSICPGLQRAGVTRMNTWLMPSSNSLTYMQNFKQHATRLSEVGKVLGDHGLRLGLEYVGTRSLLVRGRYPFVHTLAETLDLIGESGADNVGVVLDSWHWWTAGDSADAIRKLRNQDVILVDLNDAPKGVPIEDQQDGRRQLPMATGVIDVKPFLKALLAIGYDGPVRAEPFNQTLNDLGNDAACHASVVAMKKAFALLN